MNKISSSLISFHKAFVHKVLEVHEEIIVEDRKKYGSITQTERSPLPGRELLFFIAPHCGTIECTFY